MADPLDVEYKGVTITYYERSNSWRCDDLAVVATSLHKAKIDVTAALEQKLPPEIHFLMSGDHGLTPVYVTANTDDYRKVYIRYVESTYSTSKKKRFVAFKADVIRNTPENIKLAEEYKALYAQLDTLSAQVRDTRAKMEKLAPTYTMVSEEKGQVGDALPEDADTSGDTNAED